MTLRKELIDELMQNYEKPEDLLGENGLLKQLTKSLLERALDGELTHHLGHEKNGKIDNETGNTRNGRSSKKLKTKRGEISLEIPRDRHAEFEPKIVKKHQRRFDGFDEQIIAMYARGMSVREIQSYLLEMYDTEVSPDLISTVTSTVIDEVRAWQSRPLERIYPIVYLDAIRVKIRDNAQILNKAVYIALGVNMDGVKEVLGMWIAPTEGAKFWLGVMTEIKNRGVQDIFIACVDGLKGFPEAIEAVFPQTQVQLCIVHMIRHSLRYVSWKNRKDIAADLKFIYTAPTAEAAREELVKFRSKWDAQYPTIGKSWDRNWEDIIGFLVYPDYIRRAIYTTNAIESINNSLRKLTKHRGAFPNDESVIKLLYLALKNVSKRWTLPIRQWKQALNQFAILFEDRFPFGQE